MKNELLAKPKGTTLVEHINNVVNEATRILNAHPFVIEKYKRITEKDFEKRVNVAAQYHDDGKRHVRWQEACRKEYLNFLETGKIKGTFMQKTNIRHEMESLFLHRNHNFSDVLKVAIASHHGKLGEKYAHRWELDEKGRYKELWKSFKQLSLQLIFKGGTKYEKLIESVVKNYEFAGVRYYLQLADHRASIQEEGKLVPEFKSFNYTFNHRWKKRPVQQIAENNWTDDLLILRAPTGSGKTDACLLWAQKQIENRRADRLVIAMPTRFTSNALSINIASSLSETGLYHSSAWFVKYQEQLEKFPELEHAASLNHEFARLLENPVVVCTIDHLLMSLTHSREDHHSISFNLAHSCVVIDEADFYDEFIQANIIELLKILKILDVPVLLMSASIPESALQMYQQTGFSPQGIKEDTSDNERDRCEIRIKQTYENVYELSELMDKAKQQPTIIYANTIAKAMEFYNSFSTVERNNIVLYHSRFTEPDKAKKETKLLDNLGKQSWADGSAKGIAILTQIGEMSVNISADYMISDVCPIDRLVQRVGRLSRFNNNVGILDLLIPQKESELYPAPYGKLIKKQGWEPSKYLSATIEKLECKKYNAFELVSLVNQIYESIEEFSNLSQLNADKLKDQIVNHWLILPFSQPNLDEENTHVWKSRNMEPQMDIFVFEPAEYLGCSNKQTIHFRNYKDFMFYKNQYSVSCPMYLYNKGRNNSKIVQYNIWVGDGREPKSIWFSNYYDDNLGLILDDTDQFL